MKTHRKKMILTILVIIALFGLTACGPKSKSIDDIFRGEHQLRKMGQLVGSKDKTKESFFLITYNQNETKITVVAIKFAWKMNDSTYALSSLPMEKIRIKLDKNVTVPTIKFRWNPNSGNNIDLIQELMDNDIVYALITVNEKDWPTDISLPMNR
jgi:hypothetical protein